VKTRTYQIALVAAVAACLGLGGALGYVLLHRGFSASAAGPSADDAVVVRGPAAAPASSTLAAPASEEAVPLAPVQLSPQRLQEIGVTTATVEIKNVNDDLNVPGTVDIDEENLAYVQTRFPGWIQDVFANATYKYVRKGQPLFTVYSPDLVSSEQEYLLARQNQKTFAPEMHEDSGMSMAAQESGWLLQAAEDRIRQFGVPEQALADLKRTGKVQRNITIDSPAAGYITDRQALPNAYVQPDTRLYTIADLSTVWVYADVFQDAVGRLRPGDPAQVTLDAYPGRIFYGRIDQILPQVDPTTRTVRVRLVFRNPGIALKPGMYIKADIHVPLGRQMVIPASAVLESGQQAIAFVDHGQGYLEPRAVQVGPQIEGSIVVLSGLKAGERVVSSANFLIDSEAQLQSALREFAPPPPPSAIKPPAEQVQISLATQPEPPHKGTNTIRVQLAGPDGKPVTGTQVSVMFVRPAMPAMGMAAERAVVTLTEKGGGLYQGSLELPSGGTFQVTVTVQLGRQSLASKQFSVQAAGGM
jgi:RND family efflux transporter MFP subunit